MKNMSECKILIDEEERNISIIEKDYSFNDQETVQYTL